MGGGGGGWEGFLVFSDVDFTPVFDKGKAIMFIFSARQLKPRGTYLSS